MVETRIKIKTGGINMPSQAIPVFRAVDFVAISGANLGDPLSFAAELHLDDTYEFQANGKAHRLSVFADDQGTLSIGDKTELGVPGAPLHLDCCLTMMTGSGVTAEILVLVETDQDGNAAEIYILPLVRLIPRTGYTLVGINTENVRRKFAQVGSVSFSRGTQITMASGAQKPIEELEIGDLVLTRDDGPQKLRWIGQSTIRASGEFAPVRIKAGALHNENDLLVSPDHRIYIYQRSDAVGAGRHEVMVRARHLLNGETVVQQNGGFVDYFQLVFDRHQIIYAEGIAAETLRVDPRTRPALPKEVETKLHRPRPGNDNRPHRELRLDEALTDLPDAEGQLKHASSQ